MNKYQEAYLKLLETFNNIQLGINNHNTLEVTQQFNIIRELVAKSTPKKPAREPGNWGICPKCNKKIFFGRNYCPHCGQALDWSSYYE